MIYVALTLATALIATVASLASLIRSQQRAHSRERQQLLDRIMHLAGQTWTPPPADDGGEADALRAQIEALKTARAERYTLTPETATLS